MKPSRNLFLGSLLFITFGAGPSAFSATAYWDGVTGNWSDVANWSTASGAATPDPAAVPTGGDTAIFNITTVDGDQTIYLNGNRGSTSSRIILQFDNTGITQLLGGTSATAADHILYTQGITVSAGTGAVTIGDSAGSPTRRVDIQTGTHSFTNNSSSLFTIANGIRSVGTGGTTTLTFTGTGNTSILGQVNNGTSSNVVAITKTGSGTLTLSGNNIHSGVTTISNGVVNIQHANALGTTAGSTSVASGAALQIQGGITTLAETLSLNGTGISTTGALRNISGNNSYAGLVTLAGTTRINSDDGTLNLSNTGTITGATFGLSIGGAGNTTINSIIGTTTGTLTKDGAGILSLTRANTFSGGTTLGVSKGTAGYVSDGILRISNGSALGSGTLRINGGYQTASLELTDGITVANAITLEGRQGISGNGPISNLSGDNTISGDINLIANGARIIFGSQAGKLTVSGNTFTGTSGRTLNLIGDGDGEMAKSVLSANFASVEKSSGSGTWTLSSANTYATATTVTAGTLAVSGSGTLGIGAALTVNGGALDLGTTSQTVAAVSVSAAAGSGDTIKNGNLTGTSYAGSNTTGNAIISANLLVNGTAGFAKSGAGTVTLTGANTYTGNTSITGGMLRLANTSGTAIQGNVSLSTSSTANRPILHLGANNQLEATAVIAATLGGSNSVYTDLVLAGSSQTIAGYSTSGAPGTGGGSFIENGYLSGDGGAGVLTINNNSTVTLGGGASANRLNIRDNNGIGGGTLALVKDGAGTLVFNLTSASYTGGFTMKNGTTQVAGIAFGGLTPTPLYLQGGTLSSGDITARSFVAGNTVSFDGDVTLGDATNNGTLAFSGAGTLTGNRELTVASAVDYHGAIGEDVAGRSLTKTGAGTLTLSATNTYTGATTVSAGTLVINGNISTSSITVENNATLGGSGTVGGVDVETGGTFAPGNSAGTMTFTGDLTLGLNSISDFEINAFTSGSYDLALAQAAGTQSVNFNSGILNLLFQSGFNTNGSVKIFDFDSYAGDFGTVNVSGLASGYTATFNSANGLVTVVPEPNSAILVGGFGMLALLRRRRIC